MKAHSRNPFLRCYGMILPLSVCVFLFIFSTSAFSQEFKNIEYLCADWGPAMKLSANTNKPPQFSETEEEIYFLKQVGSFTRKNSLIADPFSGSKTEDIGHGISIYLCKMKPDGSEKTEIKELWCNPNHPIDTQGYSCWMDVNSKTHEIALSVLFAGTDVMGLWRVNIDGTGMRQIVKPEWGQRLIGIDHPSWTPDGQRIVFAEVLRGTHPQLSNIVICDSNGGNLKRLLIGTNDVHYAQPSVSPDGKQILYVHWFKWASWISLVNIDGTNPHQILNPNNKKWGTHGGTYPTWSPEGARVFFIGIGDTIIDQSSGQRVWLGEIHPHPSGWAHWGKTGLVGYMTGGIVYTDLEKKQSRALCPNHLAECKAGQSEGCRW